jgi:bacillopeptidase F (M6 metalloprotease family)
MPDKAHEVSRQTTTHDPDNPNVGKGIIGNSGAWICVAFDLLPYVGREIYIRVTVFANAHSHSEIFTGMPISTSPTSAS